MENTKTSFWNEIKRGDHFIFIEDMPLWVDGIGLGVLATLIFLWRYPWGISSGYGNWGNQLYYYLSLDKYADLKEAPLKPWVRFWGKIFMSSIISPGRGPQCFIWLFLLSGTY